MSKNTVSKFISLILRHRPETIGISLDEHGWADVGELIEGVSKTHCLDMETLEDIVKNDSKQRYSFSEDKRLIRANQGHSIPVDVVLKQTAPPDILFHGTGKKSLRSIEKEGLLPMSRLYVHLSKDVKTAKTVGSRHGTPIVYKVRAGAMARDGYKFYLSANGVWLTKRVPVEYLVRL